MDPRLQVIQAKLEESYAITRTQYSRGNLLAWDRDQPLEYVVIANPDSLELREKDTMGGGIIGGYEFTDPAELASFIISSR
jgi:hypothetical protein